MTCVKWEYKTFWRVCCCLSLNIMGMISECYIFGCRCKDGFLQFADGDISTGSTQAIQLCGQNSRYSPPVVMFGDQGMATLLLRWVYEHSHVRLLFPSLYYTLWFMTLLFPIKCEETLVAQSNTINWRKSIVVPSGAKIASIISQYPFAEEKVSSLTGRIENGWWWWLDFLQKVH